MSTPLHLSVPQPCRENWQQMTPQEQGRFCQLCHTTVVDFSSMSDEEVLQYFSTAHGKVCGRFSCRQLNKTYGNEQSTRKASGWRHVWKLVLATFIVSCQDTQVMGTPAFRYPADSTARKPVVTDTVKPSKVQRFLTKHGIVK